MSAKEPVINTSPYQTTVVITRADAIMENYRNRLEDAFDTVWTAALLDGRHPCRISEEIVTEPESLASLPPPDRYRVTVRVKMLMMCWWNMQDFGKKDNTMQPDHWPWPESMFPKPSPAPPH